MSYSTRGLALHAAGDGTTSDLSATCQEIILVSECERRNLSNSELNDPSRCSLRANTLKIWKEQGAVLWDQKNRDMFLRRRGLLGNLSQSEEPGSPPAPEGRNNKLKNGKRLYKPKYIVGKLLESRSCMFVLWQCKQDYRWAWIAMQPMRPGAIERRKASAELRTAESFLGKA